MSGGVGAGNGITEAPRGEFAEGVGEGKLQGMEAMKEDVELMVEKIDTSEGRGCPPCKAC